MRMTGWPPLWAGPAGNLSAGTAHSHLSNSPSSHWRQEECRNRYRHSLREFRFQAYPDRDMRIYPSPYSIQSSSVIHSGSVMNSGLLQSLRPLIFRRPVPCRFDLLPQPRRAGHSAILNSSIRPERYSGLHRPAGGDSIRASGAGNSWFAARGYGFIQLSSALWTVP